MSTSRPTIPSVPGEFSNLVETLDLATKVRLLTGATMFTLEPEPSIGLGELRFSDGPTGVRGLKFSGGRIVALLPNATLLAASWSPELAYEVGELLAEEALAQRIHVVLGPTINLHRSLLGGRLFEAYSEDPLLTGVLAAAYVNGMQKHRVGACLKHLVANESETLRNSMNSIVDEATLRELYLLPFEIAASDSDPWTMMAAYNDVNGVPATEQDHVINEVVKGEWDYTGLVMSDWFATKSAAPAANGGLDLVMPGPAGPWGDALVAAVEAGEVDEEVIDDHLYRLLVLADRVGALGAERDYPSGIPAPDSVLRRDQLTRLAAAGMTVLTNHDAVLPLDTSLSIALIGRHATETSTMGGGSASVNAPYHVSVADGLGALVGDRMTVTDGVEVRTKPIPALSRFVSDPLTGEPGVGFTLFDAHGEVIEERHSRTGSTLVGFDDDIGGTVASVRVRARVVEGGRLTLGVIGVGHWMLSAADRSVSLTLRLAGTGVGEEIIDPPRATEEFDVDADDIVEAVMTVDPTAVSTGAVGLLGTLGLVVTHAPRDPDLVIREACDAAARADVAVVVVGLTDEQETEAADKTTLGLPGRQDDLVAAVAAAATRTVVVVNAATPVLMPWLDAVDAVLWAGLPGQEGGHAVAAALLGSIEPAGRLVTTFPVADAATPAWSVVPDGLDLEYREGTFIGYRGHHAQRAPAPAFWFGHGLGYSTWDYAAPRATVTEQEVTVVVDVTNTGRRSSREVVQVYFEPTDATQPIRLVGWDAVTAEPGASVEVTVHCDRRMWRRWDVESDSWRMLPDAGRIVVARGLGDVRGTLAL
ncbi:MAG: glycoside hydrolase family 3 protein [Actinobacteria bacterium]|jgi:beta-glucosidase|nr:glycoside hydrolase family 3 protein [Actinomycetota bacterium]